MDTVIKVGDEILIRGKVTKIIEDSSYPFQILKNGKYEYNSPVMYEVEIQPEWDEITLRGNMCDKIITIMEKGDESSNQ